MTWLRLAWQRWKDWRAYRRSLCCCGNCHMGYAICRPLKDQR